MSAEQEWRDGLTARMRDYFGVTNKPVTLVRAETDLLVRMISTHYSMLSTRIGRIERSKDKSSQQLDAIDLQMSATDLALLTSIAGKLKDSEK